VLLFCFYFLGRLSQQGGEGDPGSKFKNTTARRGPPKKGTGLCLAWLVGFSGAKKVPGLHIYISFIRAKYFKAFGLWPLATRVYKGAAIFFLLALLSFFPHFSFQNFQIPFVLFSPHAYFLLVYQKQAHGKENSRKFRKCQKKHLRELVGKYVGASFCLFLWFLK
jgi:hypothetical protein